MDSEYESDSQQNNDENEKPSFKKMSKNQQIYGDFQYAYEPEVRQDIFSRKMNAYQQFKPGATIQTYSSQVQVDLPISKPKKRVFEEEEDEKPMLGKFSLNSFLNSISANDELRDIIEEDNEDSSQNLPQGLNQKIIKHLQLVKFGEEIDEEQPQKLEQMSYQAYMKTNRPKVAKVEPKYKTQQQKLLAKDFNTNYGVGFKMLQKMGFKVTKGLGKQQSGIQKPVEAVNKSAFTMKDETNVRQPKKQDSNSQKQEDQTPQQSIPEKVFQYKSKDRKINNFLIDLKNNFQKISSQIYQCQMQIDSFKKEEQLSESIRCQSQNQIKDLAQQIMKLQNLEKNIYSCELYPHLGLYYNLDLLYVREVYDKFQNWTFVVLCQSAQPQIKRLLQVLNKFYIAKSRQTLRQYEQSTGIESKFKKNIMKGKKQKQQVIDLDNINNEKKVQIGFEDKEKMRKYIEVIIQNGILPKISYMVDKVNNIEEISNLKVVDLLEVVKKYDNKGTLFKQYISSKIIPKCRVYLENVQLQQGVSNPRKLPHQVLFPWLTVIRPQDLNLLSFYRKIAYKLWNIESSSLYNILSPWIKFSAQTELSFLQNLYIAPRLLYQLEQFNISEAKVSLLNGFTQYCQLLTFKQRQQILSNTILLQVLEAYKTYKSSMEEKELNKWLSRWKKFTDKIAPGFFKDFFKDYQINI